MKVSVELSKEFSPPYAIIFTDTVTNEVKRVLDLLGTSDTPLIGQQEDRIVIIKPDEVYMIRVEGGDTIVYTEKEKYYSKSRLYETLDHLGRNFMQISKQTIVNLSCIKSVEAGFSGTLLIKLKNGSSDYVSRKYLQEFKKYLGI